MYYNLSLQWFCVVWYCCWVVSLYLSSLAGIVRFIRIVTTRREGRGWVLRDLIVTMWFSFKICHQLDRIDRRQLSFGKKCCNDTLCNDHFYHAGKMHILLLVFQKPDVISMRPIFSTKAATLNDRNNTKEDILKKCTTMSVTTIIKIDFKTAKLMYAIYMSVACSVSREKICWQIV